MHESGELIMRNSDYPGDKAPGEEQIPAHVVRAKLDIPPLIWFLKADRKNRIWTHSPTTTRGAILGYEEL